MRSDQIEKPKHQVIEVIRYIAAMSVVLVHIPTVEIGSFGVDIFFVLSGYVMMLSTQSSTKKFFTKRLIRILPTYYFFTLVVFCLVLVVPQLFNYTTADLTHLVKSLLFIPFDKNGAGHYPILFLGWTLNFEMFFYLLFAISILVSEKYRGVICTLFLLIVFSIFNTSTILPQAAYGNLIVFEFALGIALYLAYVVRNWMQLCMILLIILIGVLVSNDGFSSRFFTFGLPALGFILITLHLFKDTVFPKILVTLGGASYALYLTHPYVIQFFDKITKWFDGNAVQSTLAIVFSLILVNAISLLIYLRFELPLQKYLRSKLVNR